MDTLGMVSGNPVVDTRVWESTRGVRILLADRSEEGMKLQQRILSAWDSLTVDPYFLGLDKATDSVLVKKDFYTAAEDAV